MVNSAATSPAPEFLRMLYAALQPFDLSDPTLLRSIAEDLLDEHQFGVPVADCHLYLTEALAGEHLPALMTYRDAGTELLEFLARLTDRIEELRHWPHPTFRPVSGTSWALQRRSQPLGHLAYPPRRLARIFHADIDIAAQKRWMILAVRLRSGETIGFVARADHEPTRWAIVTREHTDEPETVLAHLCRYSGIASGDIHRSPSLVPPAEPAIASPWPLFTPAPVRLSAAVSAADELWSAFHHWLQVLETAAEAMEVGRARKLHDGPQRLAAATAAAVSPWHDQLDPYFAVVDHARRLIETWTILDLPSGASTHRHIRFALRDARTALADMAGFLFTTLTKTSLSDRGA